MQLGSGIFDVTTASTNNYGGEILRSYIGFNGLVNNKFSLGIEIKLHLYQKYNGIFMNETLTTNATIPVISGVLVSCRA